MQGNPWKIRVKFGDIQKILRPPAFWPPGGVLWETKKASCRAPHALRRFHCRRPPSNFRKNLEKTRKKQNKLETTRKIIGKTRKHRENTRKTTKDIGKTRKNTKNDKKRSKTQFFHFFSGRAGGSETFYQPSSPNGLFFVGGFTAAAPPPQFLGKSKKNQEKLETTRNN